MSHSTCTHRGWVDSRLLVVGSQTASSTPGPSFDHNLCYRCPNGSCEAIFDIYITRTFQRYKEHLKARCFDLYNRTLKFWESQGTLSSHFWECKSHLHTCVKVGLRHSPPLEEKVNVLIDSYNFLLQSQLLSFGSLAFIYQLCGWTLSQANLGVPKFRTLF